MKFIKLTSLDGKERFIDSEKILDFGDTRIYYDSVTGDILNHISDLDNEALEYWKQKELDCSFINLNTNNGTYRVYVRESLKELLKLLS